jgi:hypothetical protein
MWRFYKILKAFILDKEYAKFFLERFRMERSNGVKNLIVPGVKLMKDEE